MPGSLAKVILLGYSGHGLVVAEAAMLAGLDLIGYADKGEVTFNPFSLRYLGDESREGFAGWIEGVQFITGIGDNNIRSRAAAWVRSKGYTVGSVIHPHSSVSQYAKIGNGVFIARNAAINPFCKLGNDVIVNTSASIDHECELGNAVHIAPGAVLAGNVTIGEKSFIGANAVIKQGVTVGRGVTIGAGSVVLKDIGDGETIIGNPGRKYGH